MSALGQKRTYAAQKVMSALPLKADMCGAPAHVCFGPIADITSLRSLPCVVTVSAGSTGGSCERANQSQASIPGQLICARCRRYVLDACTRTVEGANDLPARSMGSTNYSLQLLPSLLVGVAMETDRDLADLFDHPKNLLAFVQAYRVSEDASEQPDIIAQRCVLIRGISSG
jgi:hypothetical protein